MTKHFLNLSDAGGDAIAAMIADAIDRKAARAGKPKGAADADAPLAGHTLAIVESGGLPHELGYTLESVGDNTSIGTGYTAHPKWDPKTGELHAMCYDWANLRDHIRYVVVDADGEWADETEIPLPGMTMIHDMSLTEHYAVIFDLPVTLSFVALGMGAGFPFRWDRLRLQPRIALPQFGQ